MVCNECGHPHYHLASCSQYSPIKPVSLGQRDIAMQRLEDDLAHYREQNKRLRDQCDMLIGERRYKAALAALQGLLASDESMQRSLHETAKSIKSDWAEVVAATAIGLADVFLKRLDEK